MRVFYIQIALA